MILNSLEKILLDTAARRSIYPSVEARLLFKTTGTTAKEIKLAIQRLRRAKLIYRNDDPIKNFYGSSEAGYRAVKP